jgi:antitoxin (DNA-binding transcriptional repressor) of toxin-antitoxin stability system
MSIGQAEAALAFQAPVLYIVQMKRYSAAQARQHLSDLLDAALKGEKVVIERRGVCFRILAQRPRRPPARLPPVVEILDPQVACGSWSWRLDRGGLVFSGPKRRS